MYSSELHFVAWKDQSDYVKQLFETQRSRQQEYVLK